MTHIVYRVEYTPPVPPSVCWQMRHAILRQGLSEAQWIDLGFDQADVCSVEWQESPVLVVELWRTLEAALKAYPKLSIERILPTAQEEDRKYWDK